MHFPRLIWPAVTVSILLLCPANSLYAQPVNHVPGDLTVEGRRLDGDGRALFRSPGSTDLSDRLVIANADTLWIMPGGIEPDELRKYSFRSSGVVYPSAGCWELLVHYGKSESRIVVELTAQP